MIEKKYKLIFSEEVQSAIAELVKHYHLEIDSALALEERLKRKDPEIVIFRAAQKMIRREGTFKEIVHNLKEDLKTYPKEAEKLAHDIKNKILLLVTITLEGEDKELTSYEGRQKQEKNPLPVGVKKVEVRNVEENAKELKKTKSVAASQPQAPSSPPQNPLKNEKPDPYKESIE